MKSRRVARRSMNPFSLAFLDVMSCGLGAVVLLFMIAKHGPVQAHESPPDDVHERQLLARDIGQSRRGRDDASRRLDAGRQREAVLQAALARAAAAPGADRASRLAEIAKLEADISRLRQRQHEYEQAAARVAGEGRRQYLSGSSVTGQRIAILLDASASMLAPTVIDTLRMRSMPVAAQRRARKWQRAQKVARWVMANMPAKAEFQVIAFNAGTTRLSPGGGWQAVRGGDAVKRTAAALDALLPSGGSSLVNGLAAIASLSPPPDALYLITDGLPTQGAKPPRRSLVTGSKRLSLFRAALKKLPSGVPVHTVLLNMAGDPMAAPSYWQLAARSRGTFISPTRDWP